ncbi:hypothetical protein ACL02U_19910 [Streptomyces sp. MS06]|uniref:hypothetical protein n=1 Tax=Streptomyces sp. MS06 TaxID=3385974 RepID=UPI00399FE636
MTGPPSAENGRRSTRHLRALAAAVLAVAALVAAANAGPARASDDNRPAQQAVAPR